MMIVREYRPNFFDMSDPLDQAEVENLDDALNLPFVLRHKGPYEIIDGQYIRNADHFVIAIVEP